METKNRLPRRIGIVAEWNPFHNGHETLLRTLKETYPEASLISVMSGSFVQRGEPAVFDKWLRAKWAAESGADLVVELPARCVLQSADRFAACGVRLLADLGCDAVAFGTESFGKEELFAASRAVLEGDFSEKLRRHLETGIPYSRAVNEVIAETHPALSEGLSLPNNLLGIQYARTISAQNLPLTVIPVHRDPEHPVSASAVRKELIGGHIPKTLPEKERNDITKLAAEGNITDYARYEDACLLRARLLSEENLSASGLFTEGLEHKWKKETAAPSYAAMVSAVKSKRYLTSRLRRIGAALLLSDAAPSPFSDFAPATYARILALRETQSALLRFSHIPVVTSFAKALRTEAPELKKDLLLDARATDIAAWCRRAETYRKGGADYFRSPIIL